MYRESKIGSILQLNELDQKQWNDNKKVFEQRAKSYYCLDIHNLFVNYLHTHSVSDDTIFLKELVNKFLIEHDRLGKPIIRLNRMSCWTLWQHLWVEISYESILSYW